MRVLVIGSGGREHAFCLALKADPAVTEIHVAPGNAGTAHLAKNHAVDVADPAGVADLAAQLGADLVVVGPEVPLVLGAADAVRAKGIPCFGPSAQAAQIEGSKSFAKDVMAAAGVRTARSEVVDSTARLDGALDRFGPIWVVKDDRLAAGKGVVVTEDRAQAREHAVELLERGHPVLLESYLDGPEVSLFCLVNGDQVTALLPAQDFKRAYDEDAGPNTGGMGAYAPLPWLPQALVDQIVDEIVRPVAVELLRRGCPYSGLLYAGLAIGREGPAVVEFNCRFGDPETQPVLALLRTPFGQLLRSVADGTFQESAELEWEPGYAVGVVLAAEHYPATPRLGDTITGAVGPGLVLAGVEEKDGALASTGGRVLTSVGVGADIDAARAQAYERIAKVHLPGGHYRADIALRAARGEVVIPEQR
ncbi:MAG: phosphoribosylamine--glycine ligase [Segniliparus sp.]|uniref:phosphoribosylamine--glycine ligase n=1 Tax=Segniliparus sp. TaxID=2804064 RepID=UPI003F342040